MSKKTITEDVVRDNSKIILGFNESESNIQQGTGQITTFNQLGFKGNNKKPDGWYLHNNVNIPAIILEAKASNEDLTKQKWVNELLNNITIVSQKYANTIGILYNGIDIRVFKNGVELKNQRKLENKHYYLSLFYNVKIDKQKIYNLAKDINNLLHIKFGITNLYHRMIFTACALVAVRYNPNCLVSGMDFDTLHTAILSQCNKSLESAKRQNSKIQILSDRYSLIQMNRSKNSGDDINKFIFDVKEISKSINSNEWRGEDVMGIFFNEFNRYKGKSTEGQVFTPEHITSFMYKLINITQDDFVLDAACGSGGFLVKAMSNMIQEAGGVNTAKAKEIKAKQLFGIEFDKDIYALACANMLIHKDGKTNLEQLDSRTQEARDWIKSKPITKVLLNPPYENKYGCMDIVENVLDNVAQHTLCAIIMPDKKLEKASQKQVQRILRNHTVQKIIKVSEKTFFEGVTTSIFIFEAGVPQDNKDIFTCYIEEDGLVTVKNQGRQDINNNWPEIEKKWLEIILKQTGHETIKWIKPSQHLSYQMAEKPFEVFEEDFNKTVLDYLMFQENIDVKEFKEKFCDVSFYSGYKNEKN